jgi:phage gp46-like protein
VTTDIAVIQDDKGRFDIAVENGDLKAVDGLDTALYVSLFTDARATDQQILVPEYRRGWIGNVASPVEGRQLGGLMWLVDQRRLTQTTLNEVVDYARKSLQWMLDDDVCVNVEVTGSIVPTQGIRLHITMTSNEGITESRYVELWRQTGAA